MATSSLAPRLRGPAPVTLVTALVAVLTTLLATVVGLAAPASAAAPVRLSGKVTDASGHGWPLYATVAVDGGGTVFTNPYTGAYSMSLPGGTTYTLHITSLYPGYQPATQTVPLAASNSVRNFGLTVDSSCTAPGYALQSDGTTQTFDGTTVPAGWTVVNNTAVGGWELDDPHPRGNLTGGTGGFAIVDSDFLGIGNTEDTYLVSPVVDLSGVDDADVSFDSDYHALDSVASVDISTDGGATWTSIWQHTTDDVRGPSHDDLAVPAADGQSLVQVRFHYTGTWAWWWEVDNVFLGGRACVQQTGGLVAGRVSRSNPAAPLVGAVVTSHGMPSQAGTTVATPADPNLPDGFYWLFSSLVGKHQLTASMAGYASSSKVVRIKENATTQAFFTLASGHVTTNPTSVAATVAWQGTGTASVLFTNVGGAGATVTLAVNPVVSWLTLSTSSFTLPKGASRTVQLSLDAATSDVTAPGTYTTAIQVTTSTANPVPDVPVSMTVTP